MMNNHVHKLLLSVLAALSAVAAAGETASFAMPSRPIPPGGGDPSSTCLQTFLIDQSQGLPPYRKRVQGGLVNTCGTRLVGLQGGVTGSFTCGGQHSNEVSVRWPSTGSTALAPNEARKATLDTYASCVVCEYTNGVLTGRSYLPKVFHIGNYALASRGPRGALVSNHVFRDYQEAAGPSPTDYCPLTEGVAAGGLRGRGPAAGASRPGKTRTVHLKLSTGR